MWQIEAVVPHSAKQVAEIQKRNEQENTAISSLMQFYSKHCERI